MEVGLGALTGKPLGLTAARVPALSAALCSRWICARKVSTTVYLDGFGGLGMTNSGFLADRHDCWMRQS
jgi:hypothetical protein